MRRVWRLTIPHWTSEEKWGSLALLVIVVLLTLGQVGFSVFFNNWYREFYESLQNKDFESFKSLLLRFTVLAAVAIVSAVVRLYCNQWLEMRWRTWMTRRFLGGWLSNRTYYEIELADRGTDNPDQRIADDLRIFTSNTLGLSLGLLSSVVTLASFVVILWGISGPLSFALAGMNITIPGYMLWAAVLYALVGSFLTHGVGRRLIPLNFEQQHFEADFRFGMVRVRENAEGIALYHGEPTEREGLVGGFDRIRQNWYRIMNYTARLTFFVSLYDQLAIIFPFVVGASRYFAGAITLGVLTQLSDAFGQVQSSLSWFVESYGSLATWRATVDRLLTFQQAMVEAAARVEPSPAIDGREHIQVVPNGAPGVSVEHVSLGLPNGRVVLADASLDIAPGDRVLLTGPTGAGKSTLFRAIAGIWPFGRGRIQVPANARLLFLPQRPYVPVGTLRDAVSYPTTAGTFSDDAVRDALRVTGLEGFAGRLDEAQNWSMLMSGGEQQRLAVARALLNKPDWLFMDEATAALDEPSEKQLYELLQQRLPGATIVSIAHRPRVADYHQKQYTISPSSSNGTASELQPVSSGA